MRVALVGYNGYWGQKLARVVGNLGHEIVAWIDRTNSEQLGNTDADAAIIATPPQTHYELGMVALNRGMDVLIEKPMAMSRGQAYALYQRALENELVITVDSTLCHTKSFKFLKDMEEPLISYQSIRLAPPMPQAAIPAGWDLVVHDLSIMDALGIAWDGVEFHGNEDGGVANAYFCLPTGGSAFIMASRCWPSKERAITIHMPSGTFYWTLKALFILKSHGFEVILDEDEEPLVRLVKDFADRCAKRELSGITDGEHGYRVVNALEKLYPRAPVGERIRDRGRQRVLNYPSV